MSKTGVGREKKVTGENSQMLSCFFLVLPKDVVFPESSSTKCFLVLFCFFSDT